MNAMSSTRRLINFLDLARDRMRDESGISMIAAMMALVVGMALAGAAFATANSGISLATSDKWQRLAYQRAQSGLADYVRRLANDPNYWTACDRGGIGTGRGLGSSAVNDTLYGSAYDSAYGTTDGHPYRRWLPWNSPATSQDRALNGQYTIDLIPSNGNSSCGTTNEATAVQRLVNNRTGTFRVRITGRAGPPATSVPISAQAGGESNASYEARAIAAIDAYRQQKWKKVSIVAEFRRAGFLDYVYFTDHEAIDPSLITTAKQTLLSSIYQVFVPPGNSNVLCDDYYRRALNASESGREAMEASGWICDNERPIYNGEQIKGPVHTNDSILVESFSGSSAPLFGRANEADRVEVYDSGHTGNTCAANQRSGGCVCPFRTNGRLFDTNVGTSRTCSRTARMNTGVQLVTGPDAGYIDMPTGNQELKIWAGDAAPTGHLYTGKTTITLRNDGKYDVANTSVNLTGVNYPDNGVIYVQNDPSASSCDSNPNGMYTSTTTPGGMSVGCALVEVKGTYNEPLTIGSQADIVITGNVQRHSGTSALLGLVANNYVRVRHYSSGSGDYNYQKQCVFQFNILDIFGFFGVSDFANCMHISATNFGDIFANLFNGGVGYTCERESNPVSASPVLNIQAAILALRKSFTVDSSQCGNQIGDTSGSPTAANTIVFNGAVTQKWRGAITDQDWTAMWDGVCSWASSNSGNWAGAIVGWIFNGLNWCSGHHGYRFKDFSYDSLLRALSPPHFLTPTESAWRINRLRQTAPACACGPTS